MACSDNTLQLVVTTDNNLRRNRGKLAIEDIVAVCIADKHTRIILDITLGNDNLNTLHIDNNRGKCKAIYIYLVDRQTLVAVLKRGKVLILLCSCKVVVCNPTVVRLCKVECSNLILHNKRRFAGCGEAVCHTVVIGAELDSRAVGKLHLQGVVVILNSAAEVALRLDNLAV